MLLKIGFDEHLSSSFLNETIIKDQKLIPISDGEFKSDFGMKILQPSELTTENYKKTNQQSLLDNPRFQDVYNKYKY
jgi:hypothetical protein